MNANDFINGFDPTGALTIDGAQLASLVVTAAPSSDRGLNLWTQDAIDGTPNVPNPAQFTNFVRYQWIRQGAAGVTIYVWNSATASVVPLLQWVPQNSAGIGVGTIQTVNIALGAITDPLISSMNASKLTGTLPNTVAATLLAANVVTTTSILNGAVTPPKMSAFNSAVVKASPTVSDIILIQDQAAAGAIKYVTLGSLPGTVLNYVSVLSTQACTTGLSASSVTGTKTAVVSPSTTLGSQDLNARPAGNNGSAIFYPFDTAYTPVKAVSSILVTGQLNGCFNNEPAGGQYNFVVSLWSSGTLLGMASVSVQYINTGAPNSFFTLPFNFLINNIAGSTLNLSLSLSSCQAGTAVGVGTYFVSSASVKPLFTTSSTAIVTDANWAITNTAANNQQTGLVSGYNIIEVV